MLTDLDPYILYTALPSNKRRLISPTTGPSLTQFQVLYHGAYTKAQVKFECEMQTVLFLPLYQTLHGQRG